MRSFINLYTRFRPSVRPSVRLSIRPSVGPASFLNIEYCFFESESDKSVNELNDTMNNDTVSADEEVSSSDAKENIQGSVQWTKDGQTETISYKERKRK